MTDEDRKAMLAKWDEESRELRRQEDLLPPDVRAHYDYWKANRVNNLMGLHMQKLMNELLRLNAEAHR